MKLLIITVLVIAGVVAAAVALRPDGAQDLSGSNSATESAGTETVITPVDTALQGPVAEARPEPSTPAEDTEDDFELGVADFQVETTSGSTIKLSELAQDRPTLVGFWATWCPNCRRNLPIQNELLSKYSSQVHVVEVNLNESRDKVDDYVKGKEFDFFVAYDEQGLVSRAWGIGYTNTRVLIASDGSLIDVESGDVTDATFQKLLGS